MQTAVTRSARFVVTDHGSGTCDLDGRVVSPGYSTTSSSRHGAAVGADNLMLPDIECTTKRRAVPAATITGAVNVADVGSCDCDQPTLPTWAQPPLCSSVVYLQKGRSKLKQLI
jgi:hypothetical protein